MFTVYSGSGAKDYSLDGLCLPIDQWATFRKGAIRLLDSRGLSEAVGVFESLPFELYNGYNSWGDDDFGVLHARLPMERYTKIVDLYTEFDNRHVFRQIALALEEISPLVIRFISFGAILGEGFAPIEEPRLRITSRSVEEALADARQLVATRGSISGIDRAHTAFHGYLRTLCDEGSIAVQENADITKLYRSLREQHPKLLENGVRSADITQILRTLSSIIAVLNPLRNRASLAHPNHDLLERPEADLVLNCIHTLLHYLDRKLN